jgi:hypothetical protein
MMNRYFKNTLLLNEETVLADFDSLKSQGYVVNITLTSDDVDNLLNSGIATVTKNDAQWKNSKNETDIKEIERVTINNISLKPENQQDQPNTLVFNITGDAAKSIKDGLEEGDVLSEVWSGPTVKEIPVKIIKSVETNMNTNQEKVAPAKEGQETVPSAVTVKESAIMTFDQFVNESNKKWIAAVNMEKGALKKELGKDKLTKADLAKEEAKLKKKDKDKKKPGLQLDAKDAKTHSRITLAKNLMKMAKK